MSLKMFSRIPIALIFIATTAFANVTVSEIGNGLKVINGDNENRTVTLDIGGLTEAITLSLSISGSGNTAIQYTTSLSSMMFPVFKNNTSSIYYSTGSATSLVFNITVKDKDGVVIMARTPYTVLVQNNTNGSSSSGGSSSGASSSSGSSSGNTSSGSGSSSGNSSAGSASSGSSSDSGSSSGGPASDATPASTPASTSTSTVISSLYPAENQGIATVSRFATEFKPGSSGFLESNVILADKQYDAVFFQVAAKQKDDRLKVSADEVSRSTASRVNLYRFNFGVPDVTANQLGLVERGTDKEVVERKTITLSANPIPPTGGGHGGGCFLGR